MSERGRGQKTPKAVHLKAMRLMKEEGMSAEEAFGMAWGMHREGRLTERGGYKRVKKR